MNEETKKRMDELDAEQRVLLAQKKSIEEELASIEQMLDLIQEGQILYETLNNLCDMLEGKEPLAPN